MQYHRKSIRLKDYDYSQFGYYFVMICTQERELYFENNQIKQMIENMWMKLPTKFDVDLDGYVVMPNHLHGIIIIINDIDNCRGGVTPPLQKPTLGQIIGYFKYQSTKQINIIFKNPPGQKLWQRNYYERIIRNNQELNRIRQYIINNPDNWETDRNNPKNIT